MMCDIILASPTAKFGQPEINLGIIPGGGGSQRLTHAIGKSRAMELILTGRNISAQEADKWGLVSKVVGEGEGQVVQEAIAMAKQIASKGQIAVQAAKSAVNACTWSNSASALLPLTQHAFSQRTSCPSPKDSVSSGPFSMACSLPRIRKKVRPIPPATSHSSLDAHL
jgi:enoyl-CoA hydratase/carnithine racemase